MWDQVVIGHDEDEVTRSFPVPDPNNCSRIFETHTVGTVSASEQVCRNPIVSCVSSQMYIALAIDSQVSVFSDGCSELVCKLKLETHVDCLSLSKDSELLIIGENNGTLHIFHISSQTKLLSLSLVHKDETEDDAFKGAFSIASEDGFMKICILTSQHELYVFYDINYLSICEAVGSGCFDEVAKSVHKRQMCVVSEYSGFIPYCIYDNSVDEDYPLGMAGGGPICMGVKDEEFTCGIALFNCSTSDVGIMKAYSTSNGRYIIGLDTEYHIRIVCAHTFMLISTWSEITVRDFIVNETEDPGSISGIDIKICVLVESFGEESSKHSFAFKILLFPSFTPIYSIYVNEFTVLAPCKLNQDCIYIVEGYSSSLNCNELVSSLRIQAVFESTLEARLSSLLSRKKFAEAEEFANLHHLDHELIYKTKMNVILEDLSASRSLLEDFNGVFFELQDVLSKVKDVAFIKSCLSLHLPSLEQTKDFLAICMQWLEKNAPDEKDLLCAKINETVNRIVTYQILSEQNCARLQWHEFLNVNLLSHFVQELKHSNTSAAVILWQRHQGELVLSLTPEEFEKILFAIPESVPSNYLITFLRNDFLPAIFCNIHGVMDITAKWLIQRVYLLEITDKENWPENGKEFLEIFSSVCEALRNTFSRGRISYAIYLDLCSVYKESINIESPIGHLCQLTSDLKGLIHLRREYGCHMALSDYCQEDKMSVVFLMLDRVEISILPQALNMIAKNYVVENKLDFDFTLHLYIKDVLQKSPCTWWHWETAPWEERLLVIVQWIQDCNRWMDATMAIVYKAPVPWSSGIQKLVEIGLAMEHPKKEFLRTQSRVVGLKRVLMKYDLRNFPINNDTELAQIIVNFILKQEGISALDDVLSVYQAYENMLDNEAYLSAFYFLLNNDKLDDLMKLMESVPLDCSISCCERVLQFIQLSLNDKWFLECRKEFCQTLAQAGIIIIRFLKSHGRSEELEVQSSLASILKLQKEFDKFVSINSLSSKSFCWQMLHEAMTEVISERPIVKQGVQENKTIFVKPSVNQIYRLGDILCLEREEVMAHLILKFVEQDKYDQAIDLCRELSCNYATQKTSDTLMKVVDYFFDNFSHIEKLDFTTIVETIHQLVSMAVTCCDQIQLDAYKYKWCHASVLNLLNKLTTREIHLPSMSVLCGSNGDYYKWRFSSAYNDEGLWVEPSKTSLLFCKSFIDILNAAPHEISSNWVSKTTSVLNTAIELIAYLKEKGQEIAVFRVIIHTISLILPISTCLEKEQSDLLLVQVASTVSEMLEENFFSVFRRAMEQRNPDLPFLLGVLNLLPTEKLTISFNNILKWCCIDIRQTLTLYAVAIEFSTIQGKLTFAQELSKSYDKLLWFSKHAVSPLSAEEILNLEYHEELGLMKEIISSKSIDLQAILTCSTVFNIDYDEVLLIYLHNILLGSEVKKWASCLELPKEEISIVLKKAENVVNGFKNQELILKNLKMILSDVNPYYYEILLFIHQKIVEISITVQLESTKMYEKQISLLKFLLVYKRFAPPTDTEVQQWAAKNVLENQLPLVAQTRLPFHALIKGNVYKIINPELTATSASIWLTVSSFLNLSSDELIIIAVKNTVSNYVAQQTSSGKNRNITLTPDMSLLTMLRELLQKVQNPEMSAACAMHVMKMMPPGANKVFTAKGAVTLAQKQGSAAKNREMQGIIKAFTHKYQSLAVELILHKHNVATKESLSMIGHPKQLIKYLIDNNCIPASQSVKVCKAVQEIADVVQLELLDMYFSFLCQCLNPSQVMNTKLDESFIVREDSALLISVNEKTDRINLERAICFSLGVPDVVLSDLMRLVFKKFSDLSTLHRARALCCLISVAEPALISAISGYEDIPKLRKYLNLLTCVAELGSLHLPYSINMFNSCDKLEFVERILASYSHNPKVLICCVKICLEYKIWNSNVWFVILHKMRGMSMVELQDVLYSTVGHLSHMWHSKPFADSWNFLLSSVYENGVSEVSSDEVLGDMYTVLLRCPCDTYLDVSSISEKIKELGIIPSEVSGNDAQGLNICALIMMINRYFMGNCTTEEDSSDSLSFSYPSPVRDSAPRFIMLDNSFS